MTQPDRDIIEYAAEDLQEQSMTDNTDLAALLSDKRVVEEMAAAAFTEAMRQKAEYARSCRDCTWENESALCKEQWRKNIRAALFVLKERVGVHEG